MIADHNFNPWKIKNAETQSKRNLKVLGEWGPNGTRVVAAESMWKEPLKWDKAAKEAGERHRVFCASMADVFEDWKGLMVNADGDQMLWDNDGYFAEVPIIADACTMDARTYYGSPLTMKDVRNRLFRLIDATPSLDWLILSKRPENIQRMMPIYGDDFRISDATGSLHQPRPNVWIGTSVENQETAHKRIPELLKVPAKIRFLSCEPLLGPVDLLNTPSGDILCRCDGCMSMTPNTRIDFVIIGGESGPNARPCNVEWIRSIVKQCKDAGVPCFVKQLGSNAYRYSYQSWTDCDDQSHAFSKTIKIETKDSKGGDISEWPEDLRVREFPE